MMLDEKYGIDIHERITYGTSEYLKNNPHGEKSVIDIGLIEHVKLFTILGLDAAVVSNDLKLPLDAYEDYEKSYGPCILSKSGFYARRGINNFEKLR